MAVQTWRELLELKRILIADGAWGTQLAAHGLPVGEAPEKWNLEHPEKVREVAEAYVNADPDIILTNTLGGNRPLLTKAGGADIILTNSFGGSGFKLKKAGLGELVAEVNRAAAEISRQAAGDRALVFGSVGPTGEFMAPLGTVSEEEMIACYAEQISALAQGGVDAVLLETFTDLGEAKAALKAAKESTDLDVVCSLTFDKGVRGYATMMGVTPDRAATELQEAGADIVGSNCGAGIVQMVEIIGLMAPATDLPVWAKPNAGLPELIDGKTVFRQSPKEMASHFRELVEAGASIIGGCCGTTPEHIAMLVAERDAFISERRGCRE